MSVDSTTRREFLETMGYLGAGALLTATGVESARGYAANDTLEVACLGTGGRCQTLMASLAKIPNVRIAAVCDIYEKHLEVARKLADPKAVVSRHYREILERKDIDAVLIGSPDHWHAPMTVHACEAGKDVYVEKPLTHDLSEGQGVIDAQNKYNRIVQVGTQQRSDHNKVFLMAVALVRSGRIGRVKKVTAAIGGGPASGPQAPETPPPGLNWDLWLGQAPKVDYTPRRCHSEFRWWYEYSGGKLTDWGAHHVDVAHWGLDKEATGPTTIEVERAELPVAYKDGWPEASDRFNTALTFQVKATFADGVAIVIRDDTENGVTFEGERGKIFVTRDRIDLEGGAVAGLYKDPVAESLLRELRHGKPLDGHMENFFACCNDRGKPASDVWAHHRALTTCHLANIAIRLGNRKLAWDPEKEAIVGDDQANAFLTRPQRAGYEVVA